MTDFLSHEEQRDYDRHMFRSTLVTLCWNVITEKKRAPGGFKLQTLANALGVHKSTVSRWFSSSLPNWEADTLADIANALNVDIEVNAIDRASGRRFSSPYRSQKAVRVTAIAASTSSRNDTAQSMHGTGMSSNVEHVGAIAA